MVNYVDVYTTNSLALNAQACIIRVLTNLERRITMNKTNKVIQDFIGERSLQELTHEELCDLVANLAQVIAQEGEEL